MIKHIKLASYAIATALMMGGKVFADMGQEDASAEVAGTARQLYRQQHLFPVEQQCTFDPDVVEASVIFQAFGDPENFSEEELLSLESLISSTYNQVTENLCDDSFREIFNVSISRFEFVNVEEESGNEGRNRRLQETRAGRRRFTFRAFVTATCRVCDNGLNLFGFDTFETRRRLQGLGSANTQTVARPSIVSNIFTERTNEGLSNPDTFNIATSAPTPSPSESPTASPTDLLITSRRSCECIDEQAPDRAPSVNEFTESINDSITNEPETFPSLDNIIEVAEVNEVECGDNVEIFEAAAIVTATGLPELLSIDDLKIIGAEYVETYNDLAAANCDPFFRNGVNSTVVLEYNPDGDLNAAGEPVQPNRFRRFLQSIVRTRQFRFRVIVKGRCDSCSEDQFLFTDTFTFSGEERRTLRGGSFEEDVVGHRNLSFLREGDLCFCAPDAPQKVPTEAEFIPAFQQAIDDLSQAGLIPPQAIAQILDVIEVNVDAPSAEPSVSVPII